MLMSRIFSMGLIGAAVLLAACGGGSGGSGGASGADSSASAGVSSPGAASAPDTASSPQSSTFNCPASYSRLDIPLSIAAGTAMTMVSNDNIATLTFKTPTGGVTRALTLCLGKPDPVPAGITTPFAYEITEGGAGDITQFDNRMLTFNFSTTQPVTGTPALELATVTAAGVTYSPTVPGPLMAVSPNYSVAGSPNQAALYVVRLTK
ncbi:hypothetical protein M3I53_25625 [Paraburkholderia sp. CNPSo 3272]|uniref:hypothetical protein n=1 Tax=Paraburkholderia sp. CNPSo 3272 TaxID=2940931 RepID=UPI0020B79E82|nr:hypothetical protein [Paraburkholderia sp. CNPSo 3272]MCP3726468.1 hypothetical protein [Paraburkholderia sp. CNPSo 3272]